MATFETEIRKLQPIELCTLAQILDQSDSWKKLMAIIPRDDNENVSLFSNDHFLMIEQAIRQQQRSGAEVFLSEWSTLNKKRPTCKSLLDLLVKTQLFRAADYLAVDVLKTDPPERPKTGPAAAIDVSEKMLVELLKQQANVGTHSDDNLSWSVHYVEKPVDTIPVHAEKVQEEVEHSDLMKFSTQKSDLMKFSAAVKDDLGSLPEQISDMMKFSVDNADDKSELPMENYYLQEAKSEDIPLCVNDNDDYSNDQTEVFSTTTQSTISSSSINDSELTLPTASKNDIPVMVLKYSDRSNKNT